MFRSEPPEPGTGITRGREIAVTPSPLKRMDFSDAFRIQFDSAYDRR